VSQKLLRYYIAFEKGTMSDEDTALRIRQLRGEQARLQRTRDEALAELEETEPKDLSVEEVLCYVKDLKALLSKGALSEQKAFLRSFIKRIDFEPKWVTLSYTIPMPMAGDKESQNEVLSLEQISGPFWTRTRDLSLIRTAL
jgi:site-specific DNA recombinase